jgi:hypothetical protein
MALPMPRLAPVMNRVLSLSVMAVLTGLDCQIAGSSGPGEPP